MIQALQLLLSLSLLVTLHELGHYLAAKAFGCRVEKFYLFIDWKFSLFKKQIGETEYGIGWLPLGGYVKIAGIIDESLDTDGLEKDPEPWELRGKPAWQRLIVFLGGVTVNFILAFFIYSLSLLYWGETYLPNDKLENGIVVNTAGLELGLQDGDKLVSIDGAPIIEFDIAGIMNSVLFQGANEIIVNRNGEATSLIITKEQINTIIKNLQEYNKEGLIMAPANSWTITGFASDSSLAEGVGLLVGDQIASINGVETPFNSPSSRSLLKSLAGKKIELGINRMGVDTFFSFSLGEKAEVMLGVVGLPTFDRSDLQIKDYSLLSCIPAGWKKTTNMVDSYLGQLKVIFNPKSHGYKHVGGVISIGKMFPETWNWAVFWNMTAILSIILAIMNLLPIPALDGGHALIAIGEMITGKKLNIKVLEYLQVVGMIMLFTLLIYANGMDVWRLFN